MTFIAAICPQCSGALQVPDDKDIIKCMYCGVDIVVRQAVRLVQGNNDNLLELAETARIAGNNVEAISYYNKVLENNPKSFKAWLGKGACVGWSSTLADFRFNEMLVAFSAAVKNADEGAKAETIRSAATTINEVVIACYTIARKHMLEFVALPATWGEYLPRCQQIISTLEVAHSYEPKDQQIIENIIWLCKDNIEGVAYNDPYDNNMRKTVHLSDQYENELRALMASYSAILKSLNPAYVELEVKRPSAGCFVVTATYNDPNHPTVRLLRSYRDEYLQKSIAGRRFIAWYYKNGPVLAAFIHKYPMTRIFSYLVVVKPAALLARGILKFSRA